MDADRSRRELRHQRAVRQEAGQPVISITGKALEAVYADCSAARLYSAAVRAVTELGFSIISSDSGAATLSFRTGMSIKSWQGQEMTATVIPESSSGAQVVVGGRRVTRGYQLQVFDWGEARSIAIKFIDRLTPVVAATPEAKVRAAPEPVAAAQQGSTAAELEHLARLRKLGVLTDDEFTAAKKKLLA